MTRQYPYPLTDMTLLGDETPPGDEVEPHLHPEHPEVRSPSDAIEFLRQEGRSPIGPLAAEDDSTRCAWLTGGQSRNDPFVLNWKGHLDSKWDFVCLSYWVGGQGIVVARWYSPGGWEWAAKGSPFTTSYTPYDIEQANGSNVGADYYIWDANQDMYMGEPPCS